jgi:hypothetical protein
VSLRLCLFVLLAALTACDKPLTVEQRVIATIREMESTIEASERRAFMSHIAEDFSGQQEVMTRDQVQAMVLFQLARHKNLQVQLFPIRVTETGPGLASASFTALVTGGPNWIPENGQLFEFDTRWILVDNEWLLQSANWKPAVLEN